MMKYIFILLSLILVTVSGCGDASQNIAPNDEKKSVNDVTIRNLNLISAVNVLSSEFQGGRIDIKFYENGKEVTNSSKTKKILTKKAFLKVKQGSTLTEFVDKINSIYGINGSLDGSSFVIEI